MVRHWGDVGAKGSPGRVGDRRQGAECVGGLKAVARVGFDLGSEKGFRRCFRGARKSSKQLEQRPFHITWRRLDPHDIDSTRQCVSEKDDGGMVGVLWGVERLVRRSERWMDGHSARGASTDPARRRATADARS